MTVKISESAVVLLRVKNFSSVLQTTAISETAIETLTLVIWDDRFELYVCCQIKPYLIKAVHQIGLQVLSLSHLYSA